MFLRGGGTREGVSSSPRLVLVTGGARAGKSRFAQTLAEQAGSSKRLFIATAVPCDAEMRRRIARHRRERDGFWKTLEEPTRLPERIPAPFLRKGSLLLLDCLPTFATNLLLSGLTEKKIEDRIRRVLQACRRPGVTTLLVSNEVGLGLVPENPMGRRFRDLLGALNQRAARSADEVYLLVAGLPLRVK